MPVPALMKETVEPARDAYLEDMVTPVGTAMVVVSPKVLPLSTVVSMGVAPETSAISAVLTYQLSSETVAVP